MFDKELSLVWIQDFSVTCVRDFHFNPEKAALNATVHKFVGYLNEDPVNVEGALELFMDDATFMPPRAPALTGKEGKGSLIVPVQV